MGISFDLAQAFGSEAQARRDGELVEPHPTPCLQKSVGTGRVEHPAKSVEPVPTLLLKFDPLLEDINQSFVSTYLGNKDVK